MNKTTESKIIEYIKSNKQATTTELVDYLDISRQSVFKQLKKLVKKEELTKIGKPPKVFYILKEVSKELVDKKIIHSVNTSFTDKEIKIIKENYLYISSFGHIHEGIEGFIYWCEKTKQPIVKTAKEYIKTLEKYNLYRNAESLISGFKKFKKTFNKIYLDDVFYLDFYSIERFGKTRLGQMLLYAKQSKNRKLIKQLIAGIKSQIDNVINNYNIDGVGFIPPTVSREVQLMHVMKKNLDIKKNIITIEKVFNEIAVPQKSLSKIEDRIENAKKTIYVTDRNKYKNILLIDDAVGSGSTLNETSKKIREQNICSGKIIGLALTGSFKGFDVISEV